MVGRDGITGVISSVDDSEVDLEPIPPLDGGEKYA